MWSVYAYEKQAMWSAYNPCFFLFLYPRNVTTGCLICCLLSSATYSLFKAALWRNFLVYLEGPLYLTGQVTCLSSIPFLRSRPKNPSPLMHPDLHMFMLGSWEHLLCNEWTPWLRDIPKMWCWLCWHLIIGPLFWHWPCPGYLESVNGGIPCVFVFHTQQIYSRSSEF